MRTSLVFLICLLVVLVGCSSPPAPTPVPYTGAALHTQTELIALLNAMPDVHTECHEGEPTSDRRLMLCSQTMANGEQVDYHLLSQSDDELVSLDALVSAASQSAAAEIATPLFTSLLAHLAQPADRPTLQSFLDAGITRQAQTEAAGMSVILNDAAPANGLSLRLLLGD